MLDFFSRLNELVGENYSFLKGAVSVVIGIIGGTIGLYRLFKWEKLRERLSKNTPVANEEHQLP